MIYATDEKDLQALEQVLQKVDYLEEENKKLQAVIKEQSSMIRDLCQTNRELIAKGDSLVGKLNYYRTLSSDLQRVLSSVMSNNSR